MPGRLFPLIVALLLTSVIGLSSCGGDDGGSGGVRNDADTTVILPPPNGPITFDDSLPPVDLGEFPPPARGDSHRAQRCDPNYDPCVPIDSDVDCEGGGGNGPSYVQGPVRVIGADLYGLDRDHDGEGCEK
jgi:hypothetical protein